MAIFLSFVVENYLQTSLLGQRIVKRKKGRVKLKQKLLFFSWIILGSVYFKINKKTKIKNYQPICPAPSLLKL